MIHICIAIEAPHSPLLAYSRKSNRHGYRYPLDIEVRIAPQGHLTFLMQRNRQEGVFCGDWRDDRFLSD